MNLPHLLSVMVSSPWFWADVFLGVSGGLLVWWGLNLEKAGEKMLPPSDFRPDIFKDVVEAAKSKMERGWRILKIGIVIEVVAAFGISVISGLETADLTEQAASANFEAKNAGKEAGQANERAATNELALAIVESNNLVLRSEVLQLEAKSRWRTITPGDKNRFIELTKNIFKFPIRIRMGNGASAEVQGYAKKIREMLDDAGFVETNKELAVAEWPPELNLVYNGNGIPEMPSAVFINNLATTSAVVDLRDAQLSLKSFPGYATNSVTKTVFYLIDSDSEQKAFVTTNNGEPLLNIPLPSIGGLRFTAFMQVQMDFNSIGVTTGWMTMTNVPNGVCEIFIDSKF